MNKERLLYILLIILFFGVGFILGGLLNKNQNQGDFMTKSDCQEEGIRAVKETFYQNKDINMVDDVPVDIISAEIIEVQQNKLLVKVPLLDILMKKDLLTRTVFVDNNTKIFKVVEKTPEEYKKDLEEFYKTHEAGASAGGPDMYIKTDGTLSDFEVAKQLTIKAGKDIKNVKEFTAQEITINN